jgi:hypothetical protein
LVRYKTLVSSVDLRVLGQPRLDRRGLAERESRSGKSVAKVGRDNCTASAVPVYCRRWAVPVDRENRFDRQSRGLYRLTIFPSFPVIRAVDGRGWMAGSARVGHAPAKRFFRAT